MKCENHSVKISVCIQPDGWHSKKVPGGAPYWSSGFILFRAKISIGGTKQPDASMQITAVDKTPCSAEVMLPCFLPLSAKIFDYLLWTWV